MAFRKERRLHSSHLNTKPIMDTYSKIFLWGERLILEEDDSHSETQEEFSPALFKLSLSN